MASSFVSLFTNELEKHNSCSKETVKLIFGKCSHSLLFLFTFVWLDYVTNDVIIAKGCVGLSIKNVVVTTIVY